MATIAGGNGESNGNGKVPRWVLQTVLGVLIAVLTTMTTWARLEARDLAANLAAHEIKQADDGKQIAALLAELSADVRWIKKAIEKGTQ